MPCLAVHHWHHSFTKLPSIEKWFLKAGNVSCDDGHSDLPLSQSDKAIADTWWHLASFSKILPPAAPKQDTVCLHCHREACTWHFFFHSKTHALQATHLPDKVRIIVTRSVNPAGEESMIAILQTWRVTQEDVLHKLTANGILKNLLYSKSTPRMPRMCFKEQLNKKKLGWNRIMWQKTLQHTLCSGCYKHSSIWCNSLTS